MGLCPPAIRSERTKRRVAAHNIMVDPVDQTTGIGAGILKQIVAGSVDRPCVEVTAIATDIVRYQGAGQIECAQI